jgi:hypothetical protein
VTKAHVNSDDCCVEILLSLKYSREKVLYNALVIEKKLFKKVSDVHSAMCLAAVYASLLCGLFSFGAWQTNKRNNAAQYVR